MSTSKNSVVPLGVCEGCRIAFFKRKVKRALIEAVLFCRSGLRQAVEEDFLEKRGDLLF